MEVGDRSDITALERALDEAERDARALVAGLTESLGVARTARGRGVRLT